MNFKMLVNCQDISERIYINIFYQIFDDKNNSLYVSSINNNDYKYFNNKVFIDENIFYNFTNNVENVKLIIKFIMTIPKTIKAWYIKNDNYGLILKIMDYKIFDLKNIF